MSTLVGLMDNIIRDMQHLRGITGLWIPWTGHSLIILGTLRDDTLDDHPLLMNGVHWISVLRETYCLVEVGECV